MLLSLISVTSLVQLGKRLEIIEARHSHTPAREGCLIPSVCIKKHYIASPSDAYIFTSAKRLKFKENVS